MIEMSLQLSANHPDLIIYIFLLNVVYFIILIIRIVLTCRYKMLIYCVFLTDSSKRHPHKPCNFLLLQHFSHQVLLLMGRFLLPALPTLSIAIDILERLV